MSYENILYLRKHVSNVLLHGPNKELQDWNSWCGSSYSVTALEITTGQPSMTIKISALAAWNKLWLVTLTSDF